MWCAQDLTSEEIKACLDRGDTIASQVLELQGLRELINEIRKPAK
jgi:hypothetical protein